MRRLGENVGNGAEVRLKERRTQKQADQLIWEGEIRLATPMLGGGAVSGFVDEEMPVRASSISGHLRFWWRATHGVLLPTIEAMREREDLIFGAASVDLKERGEKKKYGGRGLVSVMVSKGRCGKPASLWLDTICPGYAKGILLQDTNIRDAGRAVKEVTPPFTAKNVTATLTLRIRPSTKVSQVESMVIRKEVCDTLEAWRNYGGLGARTRRGFGAVGGETISELALPTGKARTDTPSLHGAKLLAESRDCETAAEAWKRAIAAYQLLRKGILVTEGLTGDTLFGQHYSFLVTNNAHALLRETAIQGQRRKYIHTTWPERSWIQALQGKRTDFTERLGDAPRAQFGLPYHLAFRDTHDNKPDGEFDVTMRDGSDRFASPLIVRPIKVGDKWRAAILVLKVASLKQEEVILKRKYGGEYQPTSVTLTYKQASWRFSRSEDQGLKRAHKMRQATVPVTFADFEKWLATPEGADTLKQTGFATISDEKLTLIAYVTRTIKKAKIGWEERPI